MEVDYANTEQEMGLGSDTVRTVKDPDATVDGLSTKLNPDGLIEVRFTLKKVPEFVYLRLDPLNHRRKKKNAVELVVYNRDHRFKEGENLLVLDPKSTDRLIVSMTKKLDADEYVLFTIGYSQKGANWGYGSSSKFFTSKAYQPPEEQ